MKQHRAHILKRCKALLLMLTFLVPTVVSFAHSLQGHAHFDTCTIKSDTHVHENDVDCSIGDLQMVKGVHHAFAKAEKVYHPTPSNTVFFYSYSLVSLDAGTLADRGPPVC